MKMKKIAIVGSDRSKIDAYISALKEDVKVYSHDIADNGEHNVEDKLDDYITDSSKELFEKSSVDTVLVSNPINAYVMAIQAREEGEEHSLGTATGDDDVVGGNVDVVLGVVVNETLTITQVTL